ncbi:hypothetical protein CEXT_287171 [Caerostris extrusa]|uniref:Uncharacterized protein n=1 Tax=Caerostris extrusa TaxID=172846 RepID=A0AAV4NYT7_CAEEX|nr:hypothetical protein CEXT_287171 [Caerostris extrusa]
MLSAFGNPCPSTAVLIKIRSMFLSQVLQHVVGASLQQIPTHEQKPPAGARSTTVRSDATSATLLNRLWSCWKRPQDCRPTSRSSTPCPPTTPSTTTPELALIKSSLSPCLCLLFLSG